MGLRVDNDDAVVGLIDERLVARIDGFLPVHVTPEHEQGPHRARQQHQQRREHIPHAAGAVDGGAHHPQYPNRSAAAVAKSRIAEGIVG